MNNKNEKIIEAEFSVIDDNEINYVKEKNIWMLVGENMLNAKLARVCFRTYVDDGDVDSKICVNCHVSQIEGVDIKDAFTFDLSEFKRFYKIPTKEEQKEMVKNVLLRHGLEGQIRMVSERYAEGHKSVLKLQNRIKGGAYVSV